MNPGCVHFLFAAASVVQAQTWCSPDEAVLLNRAVASLRRVQLFSKRLLPQHGTLVEPPYVQLIFRFGWKASGRAPRITSR